jgi:hypothetical protein
VSTPEIAMDIWVGKGGRWTGLVASGFELDREETKKGICVCVAAFTAELWPNNNNGISDKPALSNGYCI